MIHVFFFCCLLLLLTKGTTSRIQNNWRTLTPSLSLVGHRRDNCDDGGKKMIIKKVGLVQRRRFGPDISEN